MHEHNAALLTQRQREAARAYANTDGGATVDARQKARKESHAPTACVADTRWNGKRHPHNNALQDSALSSKIGAARLSQ